MKRERERERERGKDGGKDAAVCEDTSESEGENPSVIPGSHGLFRAEGKPGEREHPPVISGSAGQHFLQFLHGPRMAFMPIEFTLLQVNLAQKHLAMMMVKSFSMIGTNGQNMNMVTVPKLGGKSTSTTSTSGRS